MFARVSIYEVPPERVDAVAETFGQAIGQIREMTGLAEAYLLVNAENGRTLTVTLWDSRAAMDASRVTATRLRSEAARAVDGDVLSTEEYEVAPRELRDEAGLAEQRQAVASRAPSMWERLIGRFRV